jgi:hypothetical protein
MSPFEFRASLSLASLFALRMLGLFAGGAVGGWLAGRFGESAVFVFGIAIVALWL